MDAIYDLVSQPSAERIMLVMLPGVRDRPQDMVEHGMISALRERGVPVDAVAVDAHLGYYLERSFIERLSHDIITPMRAQGYARIWLVGISLGAMGALIYARAHANEIEGVIVLAPFLGVQGIIAEIERAGGLSQWQPGAIASDDDERLLLAWLKAYQADNPALPKLYLGYGRDDRFAPASQLLAQRLPAAHVAITRGGHDWATWMDLWRSLLDQEVFTAGKKAARDSAAFSHKLLNE
ncbi:MAG TPA: alpha/beta hydrolase [Burkholderiales bacterium]|jgi:pimeloyl-ACP methyl ester carboxylesterase|nr:alpha/beta hydrolase [Burkholderiales bacterium]